MDLSFHLLAVTAREANNSFERWRRGEDQRRYVQRQRVLAREARYESLDDAWPAEVQDA